MKENQPLKLMGFQEMPTFKNEISSLHFAYRSGKWPWIWQEEESLPEAADEARCCNVTYIRSFVESEFFNSGS
jgi:hypothetical protein